MQIDMTDQVHTLLVNTESLYVELVETMADVYYESDFSDEENISYIADRVEIMMRDFYLSGTETDAGGWLIRSALDTVAWYTIGREEYSDFLADRGE